MGEGEKRKNGRRRGHRSEKEEKGRIMVFYGEIGNEERKDREGGARWRRRGRRRRIGRTEGREEGGEKRKEDGKAEDEGGEEGG